MTVYAAKPDASKGELPLPPGATVRPLPDGHGEPPPLGAVSRIAFRDGAAEGADPDGRPAVEGWAVVTHAEPDRVNIAHRPPQARESLVRVRLTLPTPS